MTESGNNMTLNKRLSALELLLSAVVGGGLAAYRHFWAGDNGAVWACVAGGAALALALGIILIENARGSRGWDYGTPGKGYFTLLAASGFILVLSAGLFYLEGDGVLSLLTVLRAVFPAACGVAALVRLKQGDRDRLSALLGLFPVFYLCFFLLLFYRANGYVPVVRTYGFEMAAITVILIGMYMLSSQRFEKPRHRLRAPILAVGAAAMLMEMTLLLLDRSLLLGVNGFSWGAAAVLLAFGLQLIAGLFWPGEQLPAPPPEKDEDDGDKEEPEKPAEAETPAEPAEPDKPEVPKAQ